MAGNVGAIKLVDIDYISRQDAKPAKGETGKG
jgi:hypothetical protein